MRSLQRLRRFTFVVLMATTAPTFAEQACAVPAKDPSRIAVAGGSLTEILYFLGEEERIVAVDTTSNFPLAARELPQIGYVRALSAEGVLTLNPTLVLGEHDAGPPEVIEQLARTGIETAIVPEAFTPQGIVDKVACVITLLDLPEARRRQALERLEDLQEAAASVPAAATAPKVVVLLGIRDGVPVAAGANTSGDGLLAMAQATNVFAGVDGWKPISLEIMAQAQPDYIVIPERGLAAAGGIDGLVEHPAIRITPAG
ncbi:MAG: ABC transporter substrate-binding protein, partial [Pseudomonadota bacterium]